jgi:hypothetical protein
MSFCQTCGFAAQGASACVFCGADLSGAGKAPSQIGWVAEATQMGARREGQQLVIGEVFTRDKHGHFDDGQRISLDGRHYRLVEKVEARPPFNVTLRFELQVDIDAIGVPIDYRAFASPVEEPGLFSRLAKKLRGE